MPMHGTDKTVSCEVCSKTIHKDCAINKEKTYCDVCYLSKTEEVNIPVFEGEIPEIIRRSYIQTYLDCPFKFYNEVILGHEQPENIYAKIGIDLHDLFDKASNNLSYQKEHMLKEFHEAFDEYDEELFESTLGDASRETMLKRGLDSINGFYSILQTLPPTPYQTEQTLVFSVGDELPKVQATSDRIDIVDGEIEMLDWKTGNVMVGMALSNDIQAPLYIYSVREKYGLPVRKFTFYYVKDNKFRTFNRIDDDNYMCMVGKRQYNINLTDAIRKVQHVFSQINKGNFNIPSDTKGMYFKCKTCHIKAKGLCEGADIQAWNQYN